MVIDQLGKLISEHDLSDIFSVSGYPVWSFFVISDAAKFSSWELKTLLLQEMYANGIFTTGTHNMSYAHSAHDVAALIKGYQAYFEKVKDLLSGKHTLQSLLKCAPLKPLFKVR